MRWLQTFAVVPNVTDTFVPCGTDAEIVPISTYAFAPNAPPVLFATALYMCVPFLAIWTVPMLFHPLAAAKLASGDEACDRECQTSR